MKQARRWLALLFVLAMAPIALAAAVATSIDVVAADYPVQEGAAYASMEEVAVYLATYMRLPDNYLTKRQAEALGWDNRAGNLGEVAAGMSIGGDRFGNYEQRLPDAAGRRWTECDINFDGDYRGGERIVYSNDGLIYYSANHYQSFTQIVVTFESVKADAAIAQTPDTAGDVEEQGAYTARDDVAAYIRRYGKLPENYLTRDEAKALGWLSKQDNLGEVAQGYAIGGDVFGNREGLLPSGQKRIWRECDVNGASGKRSQERLVFSNDGLIYYTPDAHKTFIQLY